VIVRYDAERWRAGPGPLLGEWVDEVVPGRVEALSHSAYSPVYAWMFAYEKGLKRRIQRTLGRPLGPWERRLFGADGALSEGLSNAFLHGHKRDPSRVIRVACGVGRLALTFAVTDGGTGFDVGATVARATSGGAYFHVAGNGLKCFERTPGLEVAHTNGGRTLHLLVDLTQRRTP